MGNLNKVYLVTYCSGCWDDFTWGIHCICAGPYKANAELSNINKEIESIKAQYEEEFGSNFDEDNLIKLELSNEKRYEQIYHYERKYPILTWHSIRTEERDLIR